MSSRTSGRLVARLAIGAGRRWTRRPPPRAPNARRALAHASSNARNPAGVPPRRRRRERCRRPARGGLNRANPIDGASPRRPVQDPRRERRRSRRRFRATRRRRFGATRRRFASPRRFAFRRRVSSSPGERGRGADGPRRDRRPRVRAFVSSAHGRGETLSPPRAKRLSDPFRRHDGAHAQPPARASSPEPGRFSSPNAREGVAGWRRFRPRPQGETKEDERRRPRRPRRRRRRRLARRVAPPPPGVPPRPGTRRSPPVCSAQAPPRVPGRRRVRACPRTKTETKT